MTSEGDAPRKAFKEYFDHEAARALADQVAGAHSDFDKAKFVRLASRDLATLEFAARVRKFSDALAKTLPKARSEALAILARSLPPPLVNCDSITDGWLQWPVGQFIADYGLDDFDASMAAMVELTQRFSSEYAVRPFVERYPKETFARLLELTGDKSPHVRRWCSEGVRPRLPWGKKLRDLVEDPTPIWPILDALRDDDEPYVYRSVANNLNDIAKDHPSLVVARCRDWSKAGGDKESRSKLVRHALRTLVKQGDPEALSLLGFGSAKDVSATFTTDSPFVKIGDRAKLTATLTNDGDRAMSVMVDFLVYYVRKQGVGKPKAFKWSEAQLAPGESIELTKQHRFAPATIRALYPGVHRIDLQVNGTVIAKTEISLET